MASYEGASSKESLFSEAVSRACAVLNVERLYKYQYEALKHFFASQDIFFSAHTGYGKSLIFQAIPIIYDVMHDEAIGTSTVVVVPPLLSLIKDQVQQVNENCCISAAAIYEGQSKDVCHSIEEGDISLLYASPESLLGKRRWRTHTSSQSFRQNCVAVVVDEAHCLVNWYKNICNEIGMKIL